MCAKRFFSQSSAAIDTIWLFVQQKMSVLLGRARINNLHEQIAQSKLSERDFWFSKNLEGIV